MKAAGVKAPGVRSAGAKAAGARSALGSRLALGLLKPVLGSALGSPWRALGLLKPALDFPWRAPVAPARHSLPKPPLRTEWTRRWAARMIRAASVEYVWRPAVSAYAQPTRRGAERLAGLEDEAVIFVANHRSHLDTPLLMTSIPHPWRHKLAIAAASDYFFDTRLKGSAYALFLGAVPVEREKAGRDSAYELAALVRSGWNLLVYPEGGRSPDGWGQPFRGGAAYLAHRCSAPVVPVYLAGTSSVLPKGRSWPRFGKTLVLFGAPLRVDPGERIRRLNQRIEQAVSELADEARTDWWQARRRAHKGATPTLHGPEAASWRRSWALGGNATPERRGWPRGAGV